MKGKTTMRNCAGIIMAALMMMSVQTTKAQTTIHVGGLIAPQLTNFNSDIGKYTGGIGFQMGAAVEARFTRNFSAEMDLLYSIRNVKRAYYDSVIATGYFNEYTTYNSTEVMSYLQVPLLLRFNIPLTGKRIIPYDAINNNPTSISIFAGPHFAYLMNYASSGTINMKQVDQSTGETALNSTVASVVDAKQLTQINKMDFGLTAGLGINFGIGEKGTLSFEGRLIKGMNPLDKGYFGNYSYRVKDGKDWLDYHYAKIYNMDLAFAIAYKHAL